MCNILLTRPCHGVVVDQQLVQTDRDATSGISALKEKVRPHAYICTYVSEYRSGVKGNKE